MTLNRNDYVIMNVDTQYLLQEQLRLDIILKHETRFM